MIASRTAVYGRPPSIAIWTAVVTSPAPVPTIVNPRIAPVPGCTSAFMKPRVLPSVRARGTDAIGSFATRTSIFRAFASASFKPIRPARVDEQRIRDEALRGARRPAFDTGFQHAVVVERRMREHRRARDLADRPRAFRSRREPMVDLDEPALVRLDAGGSADAGRLRRAPGRHEHVRAFDGTAVGQPHRDALAAFSLYVDEPRGEFEPNTVVGQGLLNDRTDILVFAHRNARRIADERDRAAEPPKGLSHLQPDIAAADDDQMPGSVVSRNASTCVSGCASRSPARPGTTRPYPC